MNEYDIEKKLIDQLISKGYQYIPGLSGETLENNIISQLSKLNNINITKEDLADIKKYLFDRNNGEDAFAFCSKLFSNIPLTNRGKSDGIQYIRVMSRSMSENSFQVTNQYRDNTYNIDDNELSRYDVTLLINGIPIVQIELKRQDIEIDAAVNQINRYIRRAFNGWFRLVQLFVVSNETNTRYCSNNNRPIDKSFLFRWSDSENNIIDNLYKFTDTFFDRAMLYDIISSYMVRRENNGDKNLIVMRPYQIYAIKAVLNKVNKGYNTHNRVLNNGYVFHTTGSGKTLTSFKCVQLISRLKTVDRVIFLVDRQDLDAQTESEFKSFDSGLDIDGTDNTKQLLDKIKQDNKSAIITTIQKLNIAVKKANSNDAQYVSALNKYRNKHIVFIIDECHRTQFGSMHREINKFFAMSRYIGFTGTPIYDVNAGPDKRTTKSIFNEELHSYRIDSAIKDKNVLGFSIDYHNTVKLNTEEYNKLGKYDSADSTKVDSYEILENKKRIENIVSKIINIHNKKTLNRRYTALFAVESVSMLVKYYEEFKRQNDLITNPDDRLNVSAIFTSSDLEIDDAGSITSYKDKLNDIMKDFNSTFNVGCQDEISFRSELTKSLKCIRSHHIDIVIVVNIFLTGFDSKRTNTLYVDKNMVYHGLLQAFSRTNRVESAKKSFGNIVCFRPLKNNVDEAIKLFNRDNSSATCIAKTYENCLNSLLQIIDEVVKIIPPGMSMVNSTESQKVEFVTKVRKLNQALNETKQFDEFSWDNIKDKLTEDDYKRIIGQYKELSRYSSESEKESILSYIDFCMELVESDKIDLDYINKLISEIDISTVESTEVSANGIKNVLEKSTNEVVVYKKELINEFLDKLVADRKKPEYNIDESIQSKFRKFVQNKKSNELRKCSLDYGLEEQYIDEFITKKEVINKVDKQIDDKLLEAQPKSGILARDRLKKSFFAWVDKFIETFSGLI